MKIKISYMEDLDKATQQQLIRYARTCGFDHDNPGDKILLERVLTEYGRSAILKARESDEGEVS